MEKKYIIALDQGTTSSRCIVVDHNGNIVSVAQREFTQIFPKPGWVEHDPFEIWSSQTSVITEAFSKKQLSFEDVDSIGITNQRETTICWDRTTGIPVYNAIVWQCRRTADMIDEIYKNKLDGIIRKKTGLIPDAYFSASKIKWILENVPGARENADNGKLCFGTVDTWLMYNLTKGAVFATDYTNASRTMLFNIHTLKWDKELLEMFDIPESMLPEVKPSGCIFGNTAKGVISDVSIPIAGVAGDQQAALFGQCCFAPGDVKNTYGTGCFMLMNTGKKAYNSENGLLTTIAAGLSDDVSYALEGSVFVAGAAVKWLRDEMLMVSTAEETEAVANSIPDTKGVYVVPAFTGMGAPYWDQYARGTIVGLTRGAGRAEIVRATLEAISYQVLDIIKVMNKDSGIPVNSLWVDGGACRNNFLMQFQSDIMETEVLRPVITETTAMGAAYLAGLTTGLFTSLDEIKAKHQLEKRFVAAMDDDIRNKKLAGWEKAVKRAMNWAENE